VRRQRLEGTDSGRNELTTELKLSYRPPFDWNGLIRFFSMRAVRGIESVTDDEYRRSFSVVTKKGVSAGVLSVTNSQERNCVVVKVAAPPVKLSSVATRIRAMFDLSADPQVIGEHLGAESPLYRVSRKIPGIRIPGVWDPFEAAIRAVVGQQITVRAAVGLLERIVRMCGTRFETGFDESIEILFPTPQEIYDADLDGLGMPGARKKTLKAIAVAWMDGSVPVTDYASPEELTSALLAIPGVGPWTAEYIALRGFGEPDAFPSSDIALRAAVGRLLGRDEYAPASDVAEIAEDWRPWRGYAAQLLWQSLSLNIEEE
jgi:3-methyladenine DNA glycosylase/8-oxoguanine DNA glycosylase